MHLQTQSGCHPLHINTPPEFPTQGQGQPALPAPCWTQIQAPPPCMSGHASTWRGMRTSSSRGTGCNPLSSLSNMPAHLLNLCESSLHVEEPVSHPRPPSPLLPPAWSQAGTHQPTRNARSHFSSVQFSCSVMSDSLRPHEPQHARPPCPSPTPRVYPNSWSLSR